MPVPWAKNRLAVLLRGVKSVPPSMPMPNSFWVLPGRFLAGEHPATGDEIELRSRLASLHGAGLNCFLDLTEAHELADYSGLLPAGTEYRRFAIADTCVPETAAQMIEIQATIREVLARGRGAYLHCRAGIGRTGTVVGCYLAEEGLHGRKALKRLNQLWRQSGRSASWPTVPQTPEQADYIRKWPRLRISALSQRVDS